MSTPFIFISPFPTHASRKKAAERLRPNDRKPSSCITFSAIASTPTASLFPQKSPYHTA